MSSATPKLPKHWSDFLDAVDRALSRPVELHCLGGFVLEVAHGHARVTGDLDYIEIIPSDATAELQRSSGPSRKTSTSHLTTSVIFAEVQRRSVHLVSSG